MTTTALITPPRAPSPPEPPTFGAMLEQTLPLIGLVPVAGPPAILVLGPWLLFGLMLAGPFALLVTLVVVLLAAAALVAVIGAILASPYLLVRHLRGRLARRGWRTLPAWRAPWPRPSNGSRRAEVVESFGLADVLVPPR